MSWHDVMARFWSLEVPNHDGIRNAFETKVYFDHISSTDNKQDKDAVVALLESMMMSIKRDLPHITSIAVQSDNASCYQNALVILIMPIIGAANGIEIVRYIHTETQDGKCALDAHFARASQKACSWVKQGNNCATPTQLVTALTSDGGLPNSVALLVDYDREAVKTVILKLAKVEKAFYHSFTLREVESFRVRAYHYSGIGPGFELEINIQDNTCTQAGLPLSVASEEAVPSSDSDNDDGDAEEGPNAVIHADNDVEEDNDNESDDEYMDVDDDTALVSELVFPNNATGRVTGIGITTKAQIRRRQRKWKERGVHPTCLPISNSLPIVTERKDLESYAKNALLHMHNVDQLDVFAASTLPEQMIHLCDGLLVSETELAIPSLESGSAQRLKRGSMYGVKYINDFKVAIKHLFDEGAGNKSAKMGPARMLEHLQAQHPGRFDLPSENDIRAEISKLAKSSTKQPNSELHTLVTTQTDREDEIWGGTIDPFERKQRCRMPSNYVQYIEQMINENPSSSQATILKAFRARFPASVSEFTDKQIQTKFWNLKRKYRQRLSPIPSQISRKS